MGSPEFKENMRPKNTPEETGEKLSNDECYDKVWDMMKQGEDLLKEGKIDEADATVKKTKHYALGKNRLSLGKQLQQ